jgi:hypothetical protein
VARGLHISTSKLVLPTFSAETKKEYHTNRTRKMAAPVEAAVRKKVLRVVFISLLLDLVCSVFSSQLPHSLCREAVK